MCPKKPQVESTTTTTCGKVINNYSEYLIEAMSFNRKVGYMNIEFEI